MLKIRNLKKAYGNLHALEGLDMDVTDGALFGFVGPNGAGKTTTIRIMTGLLAPDSGSVEFDGQDVVARPGYLKERIGYVPDYFGVYDNLKVWEYMDFFASCYGLEGLTARKRSLTLLDQVGLGNKADSYVDGLSRGMKQRLCLARALVHDPPVLIMDEPTAGLDPRTRLEFRDTLLELNEQGKTIIISSHALPDLAEICTEVGIIDRGKMILGGSLEEIIGKVQTSKPLTISVFQNMDQAIRILKEHPLVHTMTIKDQEIMIGFTGDTRQECGLLAQLVASGVLVRGFEREAGSLEAVFMQLTRQDEERVVLSYEAESDL
ncbi:MAG: ABC transporter ATP-binding protein [Lachnospiraceae bacterium]|nr:ABC transporter ATP-binding protein [Lachnospiraceae bacterium]